MTSASTPPGRAFFELSAIADELEALADETVDAARSAALRDSAAQFRGPGLCPDLSASDEPAEREVHNLADIADDLDALADRTADPVERDEIRRNARAFRVRKPRR